MPVAFTGTLNSNEIFAAIYNMIISQEVFADNIVHKHNLVDRFKVDGSMYGDTKLYYATDVLKSSKWGNDKEAENLLKLYRPTAPKCQKITISNYRQICLTVDNYLSKKAWSTEYAFSSFNSTMLGWIGETRIIYENTLFNSYVGSNETDKGKQLQTVQLSEFSAVTDVESKNRLRAQKIANHLADLFVLLGDYSKEYNDYEFLRSYSEADFIIIGNSKYINEITYMDLPTIASCNNACRMRLLLPTRMVSRMFLPHRSVRFRLQSSPHYHRETRLLQICDRNIPLYDGFCQSLPGTNSAMRRPRPWGFPFPIRNG